jgi:transcription-repair coupling factor (superfamily II helicase)
MDLNELISRYHRDDERTKQITERIENDSPVNLHLKGVAGSALSFIAYGVFKNFDYHHLFILNDREEAAYFLNDLENLLEKKDILFIPDSFKRPGFYDEVNTNNVLLRTEAINKISHSSTKGELIISYPEALVEKFVKPQALDKKIIFLKKGEKLDDQFIIELLVENGFERTDFVYEPGHLWKAQEYLLYI